MQKNHQNILCVGTVLSVQLWLKLDFYCSFITKLLVHTVRMIRGMDMAYYLFYCPHDQGVFSAPLTGGMDTCLGIATKCWLSGDILPALGWHKKNIPENCCVKSSQLLLRVIPSGNSLSNSLFTVMKGIVLLVPPTSDLERETRASSWQVVHLQHCFCAEDFILLAQRSQVPGTPTILFLFNSLYIARENTVNLILPCIPREELSWLKEYCRNNCFSL